MGDSLDSRVTVIGVSRCIMSHAQGQESQEQDASCAITSCIVWCESGCEYMRISLFVDHGYMELKP